MTPIRSALLLVTSVWCVLLAGHVAAPWMGRDRAIFASFAVSVGLVWGTRPRSRVDGRPLSRQIAVPLLGAFGGFALFPVWLWLSRQVGLLAGSSVGLLEQGVRPLSGSPVLWAAGVLLAPAFEEPLYRERLLGALRTRMGAPWAVGLSSLAFALPHLVPWAILAAFLGGLVAGAVMVLGRSLALCIAMHAGLNLALVLCGVPVQQYALSPLPAAVLGGGALAVALGLLRGDAQRRVVPTAVR
jgi:membrane protease YdiL (CAAX protease family)